MKNIFYALLLCLILWGCKDQIEPGQSPRQQVRLSGLETAVVLEGKVLPTHFLSGSVVSLDRAVQTARIQAQVDRILVSHGELVKEGQELIILAAETVKANLEMALADFRAAQSQAKEARMHADLASSNYSRYETLFPKGALTALEYDRIANEKQSAFERFQWAESNLHAAQARLNIAKTMAETATIKAPFDAIVVDILVDSGSTVLPGTALIVLDRVGRWQIDINLPESTAVHYQLGDQFPVEVPAIEFHTTGRLEEMPQSADPQTRTVSAKLSIPDHSHLKSGLYAKVGVPAGKQKKNVSIPVSSLVTRGQLTSVFVVEDFVLKNRMIKTGKASNQEIEVLSGLVPGETIVVSGADKAWHGAQLEPLQ